MKLGQVGVRTFLIISRLAHGKSYLVIIDIKVKLGQIEIGSNIAQNHPYSPYEVIAGHYLPQFISKVDQK